MNKLYAVSWTDPQIRAYSYDGSEQTAQYEPVIHKQVMFAQSQGECRQMIIMGFPYAEKIQVKLLGGYVQAFHRN